MKFTRLNLIVLLSLILSLGLWAQTAWALDINIQVSPNVLNLQMNGQIVTIHTDVPYADVAGMSVTLNGVAIDWWKSDNRGDFVAKFNMDDIKSLRLRVGELNEFRLDGLLNSGALFSGSIDVMILNNLPSGGARR